MLSFKCANPLAKPTNKSYKAEHHAESSKRVWGRWANYAFKYQNSS